MGNNQNLSVVVLAAGKGKRMNNPNLAKVMNLIDNKPLIAHVLDKLENINIDKVVVVVGFKKDDVVNYLNKFYPNIQTVEQKEQLGTGHAVNQSKEILSNDENHILILCGDVPNLSENTIIKFINEHNITGSKVSVLSTRTENPYGYGRIIRDEKGEFVAIVEEKDADDKQKSVNEINSGVFLVQSQLLFEALNNVSNRNVQGEYYLTDIVTILRQEGVKVSAFNLAEFEELQGVNTIDDLKRTEEYYHKIRKRND